MNDEDSSSLTEYLLSKLDSNRFVVNEEAFDVATWFILDTLVVGLVGARRERERTQQLAKAFKVLGGHGSAMEFVGGTRLSLAAAAAINAGSAHMIDLDDSYLEGVKVHLSCSLTATALAVGEAVDASGRQILDAFVRGFEIAARLGHVVSPSHLGRWHPTGTLGVVGNAGLAACLYGLNDAESRTALTLAGDRAAGTRFCAVAGDITKPLHAAFAAHDGISAALMARTGIVGPEAFFEGEMGYVAAYSDAEAHLPEDTGDALVTSNSTKFFPAMHGFHAAIALAIDASAELGGDISSIESIEVHQGTGRANMGRRKNPESELEAKLSLPYCIAATLLDGQCGLAQFEQSRMSDQALRALAQRVEVVPSDELQAEYGTRIASRLVIRTASGAGFDRIRHDVRGTRFDPATERDRLDKFNMLASEVMTDAQAEEMVGLVRGMSRPDGDVGALTTLMGDLGKRSSAPIA